MFRFALALATALVCTLSSANAAPIFSDTLDFTSSNRGAGTSPLARITVSAPTTITSISVLNDLVSDGNLKFVVFDGNTLIFASSPKFFLDDGRTFKQSDSFPSLTLLPGNDYAIGAIADVSGLWAYNLSGSFSQGAITSTQLNGNVTNFITPMHTGNSGARIPIQLFNDDVAPVPEPATLAVFGGITMASLLGYRRRKATTTTTV